MTSLHVITTVYPPLESTDPHWNRIDCCAKDTVNRKHIHIAMKHDISVTTLSRSMF